MSAAPALRAALYRALAAALGSDHVHDVPPASPDLPYVTLGEAQVLDWSTASDRGEEHRLTLHAWSRHGGHGEAMAIAALVQEALHDVALPLATGRLINLRATGAEIRREAGGRTYHAVIRFRAITESN